jgi:hypothetical protein
VKGRGAFRSIPRYGGKSYLKTIKNISSFCI